MYIHYALTPRLLESLVEYSDELAGYSVILSAQAALMVRYNFIGAACMVNEQAANRRADIIGVQQSKIYDSLGFLFEMLLEAEIA